MQPKAVFEIPKFSSDGTRLREAFDRRFADPKSGGGERFVWDHWHIPGQYTLLRTPASLFFPKELYRRFHERLVWWGRENLGCHDITPTWLSCYVEGCEQQIHADVPHGPWAFVYSLTNWKQRCFSGGETFLLSDRVLDYWRTVAPGASLESPDAFRLIEPKFNQLAVFDPRIPHGVRQVRGVSDVREGRLVIHGWFVNPRPFIQGPLAPRELATRIDDLSEWLGRSVQFGSGIHGVVSFRFGVTSAGAARPPQLLTHTLRARDGDHAGVSRLVRGIAAQIRSWSFTRRRGASTVTLPLQFD